MTKKTEPLLNAFRSYLDFEFGQNRNISSKSINSIISERKETDDIYTEYTKNSDFISRQRERYKKKIQISERYEDSKVEFTHEELKAKSIVYVPKVEKKISRTSVTKAGKEGTDITMGSIQDSDSMEETEINDTYNKNMKEMMVGISDDSKIIPAPPPVIDYDRLPFVTFTDKKIVKSISKQFESRRRKATLTTNIEKLPDIHGSIKQNDETVNIEED